MPETLAPDLSNLDALFSQPPGEPLPNDAPLDDRTDGALRQRSEEFGKADDLNWLLESRPAAAEKPAEKPASEPTVGGLGGAIKSVAADIGRGAVETPRQVVGGVRDFAQSVMDLWDSGADFLAENIGHGPGGQVFDKEGNFDPRFIPASEMANEDTGLSLPGVKAPDSVTGSGIRAISQFLVPFSMAAKAIGGIKGATTLATAGKSMTAGALADFIAFDPHEARLANLIEEYPELQNPLTEYLAAEPGDGEIEGRLKNAVEGLGLGVATLGLMKGFRAYRSLQAASREAKAPELAADVVRFVENERTIREAGEMSLIGSAAEPAPLLARREGDRLLAFNKGATADAQTATGVPDDVAARSLTTDGLTPLGGADDVYVNFAKIDAPEDIQRIIQDTSTAFADTIDGARRGVRTNAETILSADKIDAWQTLLKRRKGEPLNAEHSVAARQLWATAADKLGQVAEAATKNPTPENLFQFRRMLATFHAVQKEVIAARTETARALQTWAIPVGGNLERMRDMTEALDRAGGAQTAEFLARRFAVAAKSEDAARIMSELAEKSLYAKSLGSIQEYWINALLSNPKTHAVNILSNAGVVAQNVVERGVASRWSSLIGSDGVEIGEGLAQVAGLRGGVVDALVYAAKALRTGQTGYGMSKLETPRQRFISSGTWNTRSDSWVGRGVDAIGSVVNVPGKMLQAEDEFFKTLGYRMEIHAQAHRTAAKELKSGKITAEQVGARRAELIANPPEAMRMEAVATAAYQTFTSEPGTFVKGVQRIVSEYPTLRFVLPFINTPANILKYTFERSPLAPASAKYRAAIAKGGADADLAQTKMALGTMTLMAAMDLAMNGQTTGSGPTDNWAEMQNWRRQGNQPYSVKFGDTQIAFNRMDPLGYHLGIAADIAEYVMNADTDGEVAAETEEAMAGTVFAIAENITSKSYLEGLSMLMEAVNDPQRFSASYLERFAASFIPAGVGEIARFADPVMRHSHDIVSGLKRKLPGYSSNLPARRDLWGREVSFQSGIGKAYDTISPLYGSQFKPEPIDAFMEKDGWFVGMGGNGFTIEGEYVSLRNRPAAKNRLYEIRGGTKPSAMSVEAADVLWDKYGDLTLLETLNQVVTGEHDLSYDFEGLETADDREVFVKDIVNDYYKAAKAQLFDEYPELMESVEAKKKARR